MKKVVEKYFGMVDLYLEAKFKLLSLIPKVTTWVARVLN
jgi:hypothetical protein